MPDIVPRRRLLLASATTLPLLLATAGCRSSDAFTGPDPLAGRPRPAPDVVTLQAVIASEQNLIELYRTALSGDSAAAGPAQELKPLLAQHEQHLTQLRARLIQPPGTASAPASASPASASPSVSPASASPASVSPSGSASAAAPAPVTLARLRAAEGASAAGLVRRLATVEPALAQLFASIAACDATHVTALGG
ncbi:MAG TPA: hypothetical protein VHO07_27355 [Streptosporangiaceae bacterium]|nr:hypothetical protein [Streptosporangiaceae bacterium]